MTDDHDKCEWVNVSSTTGSLGLSRNNCVCVCVCVCVLCVMYMNVQLSVINNR